MPAKHPVFSSSINVDVLALIKSVRDKSVAPNTCEVKSNMAILIQVNIFSEQDPLIFMS